MMRDIGDDAVLVAGRKIRVADYRQTKDGRRDGVDAPYGFTRRVKTPWGAVERCTITPTPNLIGGLDYCAQVYKPKSNPHVHFCTFWVNELYS